jgi:radical SAM superfamily enzyme YgiQ (UPF0313 family)
MARVAFCQDIMVEYMGFMTISAVLKQAGHTVEVFFDDQLNQPKFIRQLQAFRPDVVGFSLLSPSVPWAMALAKSIKQNTSALTIAGNVHAIMCPELIHEEGLDILCRGEGEYALLELCNALDHGEDYSRIQGLIVKTPEGIITNALREELVDLDAMPFADRTLYNKYMFFRRSKYLRVLMGRGCPFRCSYCSNPVLTDHYGGGKKYFRRRSPESAVAEIEAMIKMHPGKVKHIYFLDEVLWIKNQWLRDFLKLYKERINLPYGANFRFGGITEEDIMLMAETKGRFFVATETGDEQQRMNLLKKPVTNEHILQVTGWMHKHGVGFWTSAFFGLPGDTPQDHRDRLKFFRQVKPRYLWTTFFQPYPGIALTQHEDVQRYLPQDRTFSTLVHEAYLDLPDRDRIVNIKKVYHLMYKFPLLEGPLFWLTQFRIPMLFSVLFWMGFTWHIFWTENLSLYQWLYHIKVFGLNPILRKKQPLQSVGRPFSIPYLRKALKMRRAAEAERARSELAQSGKDAA